MKQGGKRKKNKIKKIHAFSEIEMNEKEGNYIFVFYLVLSSDENHIWRFKVWKNRIWRHHI